MRRLLAAAILLALTGCSSTPEALEGSSSAAHNSKKYSENYQAVFRRLSNTAKRCHTTVGAAAFTVDAELYGDLGYGEVTMSLVSTLYPRNYYWKAKIEREGSGSKLTVTSGNTLAKGRYISDVIRWADGDTKC